ncbi:hypothetical protein EGR_06865 [Echinococcus granulosus]|uniref:Uncharacterized protein n=1 Tax=Echinococcus granulosus TaxID=6210 RepID=W6UAX0_ECHGR|nr:hypothetical protein EGR_06865 [Echinococcus granulosus]EUB58230.1 hypothetical protein EGR_06865 [Echinococcus granulosus]
MTLKIIYQHCSQCQSLASTLATVSWVTVAEVLLRLGLLEEVLKATCIWGKLKKQRRILKVVRISKIMAAERESDYTKSPVCQYLTTGDEERSYSSFIGGGFSDQALAKPGASIATICTSVLAAPPKGEDCNRPGLQHPSARPPSTIILTCLNGQDETNESKQKKEVVDLLGGKRGEELTVTPHNFLAEVTVSTLVNLPTSQKKTWHLIGSEKQTPESSRRR